MILKLFNTLTRNLEPFEPINPPKVAYYSCGPTVYDYAHIGHARTYIFADILQRVMNITDVGHLTSDADSGEDKMEKGANREKKSVWDIAKFYTKDFFEMTDRLNIKKPEIIIRATDFIPQMIKLIKKLEEKGYAYQTGDGIYFNSKKLSDYGKLTGKKFEELEKSIKAGARIELVPGKKNVTDFALWKFTPKGIERQMELESPWGKGFPGWHIECSTMAMDTLGESIDIHTGGVDHIQIHHTNEIAQSEAATGKHFVAYWLHAGHLTIEGEKMSKSLNNFYRVADLIKRGFDPIAIRYLFLTAHYRKEMNFSFQSLDGAQNALRELRSRIKILRKSDLEEMTAYGGGEEARILRNRFAEKINDDLNTAEGLAVLWEVIKSNIPKGDKLDSIYSFDEVLGLGLKEFEIKDTQIPKNILNLVKKRETARSHKEFDRADRLRNEIESQGFILEDTPDGSVVKKK